MSRRFIFPIILMCSAFGPTSGSFTAEPHAGQERKTLPIAGILKQEGSAVVMIDIHDGRGDPTGQASGVIIRADGVIATNFHVIEAACDLRVVVSAAKV